MAGNTFHSTYHPKESLKNCRLPTSCSTYNTNFLPTLNLKRNVVQRWWQIWLVFEHDVFEQY